MSGKGILFDFDGTLVPNLDLADMRRQIAAMATTAGVPDAVHADLYIVEIIEASRAWLIAQERVGTTLANQYAAASHQPSACAASSSSLQGSCQTTSTMPVQSPDS